MRLGVVLMLAGCMNSPVLIEGTIRSGSTTEQGQAGGVVVVLDSDGEEFDRSPIKARGGFEALAPRGSDIFLEVRAPTKQYLDVSDSDGVRAGLDAEACCEEGEMSVTSFNGASGFADSFSVEPGQLYAFSRHEQQDWERRFAGCPGVGEPGGVLIGEIRLADWTQNGEYSLITTGFVWVEDTQQNRWDACYLDEEGIAYSEESERTGEAGAFAIFGLPSGQYEVTVAYNPFTDVSKLNRHNIWVPDSGVVPLLPAWVEFFY